MSATLKNKNGQMGVLMISLQKKFTILAGIKVLLHR
jgi:hypothetical protein